MNNRRRRHAKKVRAAGGVRGFWSRAMRVARHPWWQRQNIEMSPEAAEKFTAYLNAAYDACVKHV